MRRTGLVCLLLSAVSAAQAGVVTLINNGDFETGNTSSWVNTTTPFPNTTGSCNDSFAAQSTGAGCIAGTAPAFGTFAAISSTTFPVIANDLGEFINTLDQDFVVPAALTSATLSLEYAAIWGGGGTFRGVNVEVSLLKSGSFLDTIVLVANPQNSGSVGWTLSTTDVTADLAAHLGETLTLRLYSVAYFDTRDPVSNTSATTLNTGYDNVQITATTPGGVPEPGSVFLLGGGLLALIAVARLKPCAG